MLSFYAISCSWSALSLSISLSFYRSWKVQRSGAQGRTYLSLEVGYYIVLLRLLLNHRVQIAKLDLGPGGRD